MFTKRILTAAIVALAISITAHSAQAFDILAPHDASGLLSSFQKAVFTGAPVPDVSDTNWVASDLMVLNKGQQPVHLIVLTPATEEIQPGTRLSSVNFDFGPVIIDGVFYDLYTTTAD